MGISIEAKKKSPSLKEQHAIWKSRKALFRHTNSPLLKTAKKATRFLEKQIKQDLLKKSKHSIKDKKLP
ncbi:hypothetical protein NEIG_01022 [Nematocida sp. ERTm5]|nr:hypothetical protein NEIRO02_0743 [Nematocida sp. AWRm79]KAI5183177.1 hypothetical protein NEIRO03_0795 [Nematocida sp. AWRm78]OAG33272.1 hypothetical protein NEIG_01022 [Nematocida sp. ERTm5]